MELFSGMILGAIMPQAEKALIDAHASMQEAFFSQGIWLMIGPGPEAGKIYVYPVAFSKEVGKIEPAGKSFSLNELLNLVKQQDMNALKKFFHDITGGNQDADA